jgi:PAS domain S-box-containing protein
MCSPRRIQPGQYSNDPIREQAVSNLQGSEQLFRLAVEACPNGMLMIDHIGTIVLVNAAVEQLFGYPREELVGEPVDILVPARLRSHHIKYRDEFARRP